MNKFVHDKIAKGGFVMHEMTKRESKIDKGGFCFTPAKGAEPKSIGD